MYSREKSSDVPILSNLVLCYWYFFNVCQIKKFAHNDAVTLICILTHLTSVHFIAKPNFDADLSEQPGVFSAPQNCNRKNKKLSEFLVKQSSFSRKSTKKRKPSIFPGIKLREKSFWEAHLCSKSVFFSTFLTYEGLSYCKTLHSRSDTS